MWQYSRPTHFIVIYFDVFSPFDGVKLSLAHRGSKIFIFFFWWIEVGSLKLFSAV